MVLRRSTRQTDRNGHDLEDFFWMECCPVVFKYQVEMFCFSKTKMNGKINEISKVNGDTDAHVNVSAS